MNSLVNSLDLKIKLVNLLNKHRPKAALMVDELREEDFYAITNVYKKKMTKNEQVLLVLEYQDIRSASDSLMITTEGIYGKKVSIIGGHYFVPWSNIKRLFYIDKPCASPFLVVLKQNNLEVTFSITYGKKCAYTLLQAIQQLITSTKPL